MKTIRSLNILLASALLTATPLCAQEPAKKPAMGMMKPEMGAKMKAMESKMKAEAAEFDELIDAMNSSIGDRKIEAMAAVINKMAQKEKAMKAMCGAMMMGGMDKKDGKPGAQDYYTCTMHPEIRWPIPAKCPICAMELVPASKKPSDAKPGEEARKPADPHAGHH